MTYKRMRKFGTEQWLLINNEHQCLFCTFAAQHTAFREPGNGIFIEDDDKNIHIVECMTIEPLVLSCEKVTPEYARQLITHEASN